MPPLLVWYEVRADESSDSSQDPAAKPSQDSASDGAAGKDGQTQASVSSDSAEPTSSTAPNPTASSSGSGPQSSPAGLIAGTITSIAIIIFLLVVVIIPYLKKRKQAQRDKSVLNAQSNGNGGNGNVSRFLNAEMSYNRGQRRLSLVDKLAVAGPPPRASGDFSGNKRMSGLGPIPKSPVGVSPFSPLHQSFTPNGPAGHDSPLHSVPLGGEQYAEKDAGEYGFVIDEKHGLQSVPPSESTPLSAYIEHHLKTYSANGEGDGRFPVSAPVYQTGFRGAPQKSSNNGHRRRRGSKDSSSSEETMSSPESAYTHEDYSPSEHSDYYDDRRYAPPPSAPARGKPSSRSPVGDLIRTRSTGHRRSSSTSSSSSRRERASESANKSTKRSRSRPPPLDLSPPPEDIEFTINPTEYHHYEDVEEEASSPWQGEAHNIALPPSALPSGLRTGAMNSSRSNGGGMSAARSAKSARSAVKSARSPYLAAANVPIPVTPTFPGDQHFDDDLNHIIISPTPDHGTSSFADVPYPRSGGR